MISGSWGYSSVGRGSFGATPTVEAPRPTRRTSVMDEESRTVSPVHPAEPTAATRKPVPAEYHKPAKKQGYVTPVVPEREEPGDVTVVTEPQLEVKEISGASPDTDHGGCEKEKLHKVIIKAMVVVAEKDFQKVGTLDIPAPVGVGIDVRTGELTRPVRLEPIGAPVLKPVVLEGKLVNEGFVRARLIVEECDANPCTDTRKVITKEVVIPFQSIHEMDCVRPGDHVQEFSEIEALLVSGLPAQQVSDAGCMVNLRLKAILKAKVVVTQECILAVPAEVLHCLPGAN